jgi:hypothetical protein
MAKRRKFKPDFLAYFDGWRCVAVVKEGRKWVFVQEVDGTKHKISTSDWSRNKKYQIAYKRGHGYYAVR